MDGIDHLILDEGEVTLPPFIADWREGKAARVYSSGAKPSLDSGPMPRFDLVAFSDYANYPLQFSRGCSFNFRTLLPEPSLIEGYFRVLKELYRPRAYFDRCLELLSRFPSWRRQRRPGQKGAVSAQNLVYLFRSLFVQGFSRYGLEYLRYVIKAMRICPRLIEDFITYAVQGRHFLIITRRFLRGRAAALAAAIALQPS